MPIEVTQKQQKKGYLEPIAIGGVAGYCAKWAIPVANWEKNDYYKNYISVIKKQSKNVKDEYISSLKLDAETEQLVKHPKIDQIKALKGELKNKVLSSILNANREAKEFRVKYYKSAEFLLKNIRSEMTFITIGSALAFAYTLGQNIIKAPKKQTKVEKANS